MVLAILAAAILVADPAPLAARPSTSGTCLAVDPSDRSLFQATFNRIPLSSLVEQLTLLTHRTWLVAPEAGSAQLSLVGPQGGKVSLSGSRLVATLGRGFDALGLRVEEQNATTCALRLEGTSLRQAAVEVDVTADGLVSVHELLPAAPPREPPPAPVPAFTCDARHVPRSELDWLLTNLGVPAMQAHYVPAFTGQKQVGYRLIGLDPSSCLARAGLRSHDVVRAVNGRPITTPEQALRAITQLGGAQALMAEVERDGAVQVLRIDVTP